MNHVIVTSALELSKELRSAVEQTVEAKLGSAEYDLKTEVDPTIIGGVRIRINSRVYDATVQGKLAALKAASK